MYDAKARRIVVALDLLLVFALLWWFGYDWRVAAGWAGASAVAAWILAKTLHRTCPIDRPSSGWLPLFLVGLSLIMMAALGDGEHLVISIPLGILGVFLIAEALRVRRIRRSST